MFDFDSIREIFSTISKNKMRTALTGFAVAWGIFMLVVLLAAGNGLRNGVKSNFEGRATNTISIWPGWTSKPYNGMPSDRKITLDQRDYDFIRNKIPGVEYISPRINQSATISYGQEYGSWRMNGVSQDVVHINNLKVLKGNGRFLNEMDIKERRKVIVISPEMKTILFKEADPVGKYILVDQTLAFKVIGVYDKSKQFDNSLPAYIPFTTAQMLYDQGWGYRQIEFTITGLKTLEENEVFIEKFRERMGKMHMFDPQDRSALYVRNTAEMVQQTESILNIITLFIAVVGICSLMAGIVGVGNIMLITVKERTREIGIRKALGATPVSMLKLIIFEALFITAASGYAGLVLGIGVTELINYILIMIQGEEPEHAMFLNPTVDMGAMLLATGVLVVSGVVAGLIPALRATRIRPIEAMREE